VLQGGDGAFLARNCRREGFVVMPHDSMGVVDGPVKGVVYVVGHLVQLIGDVFGGGIEFGAQWREAMAIYEFLIVFGNVGGEELELPFYGVEAGFEAEGVALEGGVGEVHECLGVLARVVEEEEEEEEEEEKREATYV